MGKTSFKKISIIVPIIFTLVGVVLFLYIISPEIEYQIDPPKVEDITKETEETTEYKENRLIIPSIGVDMDIGQDSSFLDFGGWIQSVDSQGLPNMIAVHRFGWETLSPGEKVKQTLYHIYKLNEGDKVFVFWNGKKYPYRIIDIVEANNNPEFNNLVIYTCKFYSSNKRIFVLLEVIDYS